MDPSTIVSMAQKSLGDNSWNVERVLRIGAELLSYATALPNLSYRDKIDLVCQTILKMLEHAEKAERVLMGESTGKEMPIHYLEECKKTVLVVLPVTLELASAAQSLPQFQGCFSWLSGMVSGSCFSVKAVHDTVKVVEDALKHPQEYLEEMRDLVAKVEKLVSEASALKLAAEPFLQKVEVSPSPPNPEPRGVSLPGELAIRSEVEPSQ